MRPTLRAAGGPGLTPRGHPGAFPRSGAWTQRWPAGAGGHPGPTGGLAVRSRRPVSPDGSHHRPASSSSPRRGGKPRKDTSTSPQGTLLSPHTRASVVGAPSLQRSEGPGAASLLPPWPLCRTILRFPRPGDTGLPGGPGDRASGPGHRWVTAAQNRPHPVPSQRPGGGGRTPRSPRRCP